MERSLAVALRAGQFSNKVLCPEKGAVKKSPFPDRWKAMLCLAFTTGNEACGASRKVRPFLVFRKATHQVIFASGKSERGGGTKGLRIIWEGMIEEY